MGSCQNVFWIYETAAAVELSFILELTHPRILVHIFDCWSTHNTSSFGLATFWNQYIFQLLLKFYSIFDTWVFYSSKSYHRLDSFLGPLGLLVLQVLRLNLKWFPTRTYIPLNLCLLGDRFYVWAENRIYKVLRYAKMFYILWSTPVWKVLVKKN